MDEFTDEYWLRSINNPNQKIEVTRKVLWSAWNVISATPFDLRDKHWDHACREIRKHLNEKPS